MADYTLRYSGEEIDSICDKVTNMNFNAADINSLFSRVSPLRMYWGWTAITANINARNTGYHYARTFPNILPEDSESRNDIFILVSCDFGGEVFSEASVAYKKNGRNVEAEFLVTAGGEWSGKANELGTYTFNAYCLVIYLQNGGWHVG